MNKSITSDGINNFNLSDQHNFLKPAGYASRYVELSINDLTEENNLGTLSNMYNNDMPFIVFGKSTNLYITDQGYNGTFIRLNNRDKYLIYDEKSREFIASANTSFSEVVKKAVSLGYDFSDLAGIPGLIGSAVVGNAGTHLTGKTIGDLVTKIRVYDFEYGKYETIIPSEYKGFFSERNSILKKANERKMRYLILSVTLQADYIGASTATARKKEVMALRRDSDIEGFKEGTAGSFWANGALPEELKNQSFKVRDIIRKVGLHEIDYNGAGYTSIKCFLKTGNSTTDSDVACLLKETMDTIYSEYCFVPCNEVQILDYDGIISAEQFISRYYAV